MVVLSLHWAVQLWAPGMASPFSWHPGCSQHRHPLKHEEAGYRPIGVEHSDAPLEQIKQKLESCEVMAREERMHSLPLTQAVKPSEFTG